MVHVLVWISKQYRELQNNRGAETIEWLALAAVVVAILLAVMGFATDIGTAIMNKLKEFIDNIKVGG